MRYSGYVSGRFITRPNRFIAHVEVEGSEVVAHVKNTGRCKELLIPGAQVYLVPSDNTARKTRFDLVAVEKQRPGRSPLLINMDAQAPNQVFQEWARGGGFVSGLSLLRGEKTYGNSRFDFYWEAAQDGRKGFVEVKGVTLERDGRVYFPDAPTQRGVKHLEELIACHAAGYEAAVCFVIQMEEADSFSPNDETHPAFGQALRKAAAAGVKVMAWRCQVTPDSLALQSPVPVILND